MYPKLFQIGSFPIYSYGMMLVIAFLVGVAIARKRAVRFGLLADQIWDMSVWVLIAGVLGARIVFILQEIPFYSSHPEKLFTLRFDGLTSYGGLLGGLIAYIIWSARAKKPLLNVLDCIAPAVLVGHAIGRIGCLLNGCCYGGHCDLPWAIHVPDKLGLFHPAQAYDTIFNLIGFSLFLVIERPNFRPGQAMSLFLILHGLARVIYEFWRMDASSARFMGLAFTEAQLVSALMVLVGAVLFYVFGTRQKQS